MALKAGRVGVAPDQVDNFGKVKSEAASSITSEFLTTTFTINTEFTKLSEMGCIRMLDITLSGVTVNAHEAIATIAQGHRPHQQIDTVYDNSSDVKPCYIGRDGVLRSRVAINNGVLRMSCLYLV